MKALFVTHDTIDSILPPGYDRSGFRGFNTFEKLTMDPVLQEVHDTIVQGIGELADFLGFSTIMGHLYGALLMNPNPMSLDELELSISKSKASVSMNMRALECWGMVREVWVKRDRKKYYAAEMDFWKIGMSILQSRERREVEVAIDNLDESIKGLTEVAKTLDSEDALLASHYLERTRELRELFGFAMLAIDLILTRLKNPDQETLRSLLDVLKKR